MEQTKYVKLPIVGRVQHGENVNNRVRELGYFITKIQDKNMQSYLEKFNKLFKGKKSIDVSFFNDEPLSIRYSRSNQSGEVCYCMIDTDQANQKTKNGWQKINCDNYNCQYRQKNENGKSACNRLGWLKFLIPSISTDRIFLMKITGQESLNNLDGFFALQRLQGNSLKNQIYTIFLTKKEQTNSLSQKFNNYVLDILKKENFISNEIISNTEKNQEELSTINDKNVNKKVEKQEQATTVNKEKEEKTITNKKVNSATNKKSSKNKIDKIEKSEEKKHNETSTNNDINNTNTSEQIQNVDTKDWFVLLRTFAKKILNKGTEKEYVMGEFVDTEDNVFEVAIRPEDIDELLQCDLGTIAKLEIKDVAGTKFATKLEFMSKTLKKAVA